MDDEKLSKEDLAELKKVLSKIIEEEECECEEYSDEDLVDIDKFDEYDLRLHPAMEEDEYDESEEGIPRELAWTRAYISCLHKPAA